MSTHVLPWSGAAAPADALASATAAVRAPSSVAENGTTITFTYTPDLTAAEVTALTAAVADVLAAANTHDVTLTLAEYQAIKPDIASLRSYAGIASPTLAQTVAAVKAQSRILRALLRD